MPTVSVEYEKMNKVVAKVILSLLAIFGILEVTSQEGTNGDAKSLKLVDGYKKQHLVIVGNGLSQICARTFNELIG